MTQQRAVLAGGCFWGMQDLIRRYDGVISTRVGYTGGEVPNATYRNHGTHAEAIEIVFDPSRISYLQLLELFSRSMTQRRSIAWATTWARAIGRQFFTRATSRGKPRKIRSPTSTPQVCGRARW